MTLWKVCWPSVGRPCQLDDADFLLSAIPALLSGGRLRTRTRRTFKVVFSELCLLAASGWIPRRSSAVAARSTLQRLLSFRGDLTLRLSVYAWRQWWA